VARPIFDESYELARAAAAGGGAARETGGERLVSREAAIEFVAEQTNQIDVRHFGAAADIVGLTQPPVFQHKRDSGAVILHE